MSAANITFTDGAGMATLTATDTIFRNWVPDAADIGESDVGYGTGTTFKFVIRRDYTATFDMALLPATALAVVQRLKLWLEGGGSCIVDTQDTIGSIYTVVLQPGFKIKPPAYDSKNIEYTLNLGVLNTAPNPLLCFYNVTGVVGVGGGGGVGPFTIVLAPTQVVLDLVTVTQFTVSATITDSLGNPAFLPVLWSVLDPSVAQIDQTGRLTAIGNGTTTAVATAGGTVATIPVVVQTIVVTNSLVVNPSPLAFTSPTPPIPMAPGLLSAVISSSVNPVVPYTLGALTWSSDNGNIRVTDNNNGTATVTPLAGGQTGHVTCTLVSAGVAVVVTVTTAASAATSVFVNPTVVTFTAPGQTQQLTFGTIDQYGKPFP